MTTRQVKAARALCWAGPRRTWLSHSGISEPTVAQARIDGRRIGRARGDGGKKIRQAIEAAGVEFIDENGVGPGCA